MTNLIKISSIATVIAITLVVTTFANAGDPTQSKWYKRTQWVDPVYKTLNYAAEQPVPIPDSRYNTFKYSWKAGKYIAEKGRFGERLYNRFEHQNRKK